MAARPVWAPDESQDKCTSCKSGFSFFNRRHHCRGCGGLFCYECTRKYLLLPESFGYEHPEKVCDDCYRKYSSIDFNTTIQLLGPPDAPTIVLLHPALFSRKAFVRQEEWGRWYRLLIPDLPGHGARLREKVDMEQSVKLVAELISSAVPSKKAFIVGVHLGGYVAMLLAGRHPELCAGVVVISACTLSPRSPYSGVSRERISVLPQALLNPGLNDTILADVFSAIKAQWYTDWLPRYNGPILFIVGENEPRDAEKTFTSACKGARLRVVLGGDHFIWIDDKTYKKVNQYILQFAEAIGWKGVGLTLKDNPFLEEDKNVLYNVQPTTDS